MKKFFALLAVALFSVTAVNSVSAADDVKDNGKTPHVKGFISNKFWDNWEVQVGVGPTFNLATGSGANHAVHVAGMGAFNKWFHPVFGVRLAGELGKYHNLQTSTIDNKWSYIFVHPDLLVDLTNWIGGYNQDRVWNSIVYGGAGVFAGGLLHNGTPTVDFAGVFGWQNRFNVCKAVSVDLTLEYILADSGVRPKTTIKGNRFHGLNLFVGATYKFNKRTFDRSGATEEEAKAILARATKAESDAKNAKERNKALEKLNDEQAAALADAEKKIAELNNKPAEVRPQAGSAKEAVETDNYNELLFYNYGYATLTDTNKKRLDLIAEHIKADSSNKVYRVDGFADPYTGSKKANQRLAGKRAKIAADYLVSKGVDAARLDVRNCGTVDCPFGKPVHNRIVVVY